MRGKNVAVDRPLAVVGGPSHGTTGTIVTPALAVVYVHASFVQKIVSVRS